MVGEMSVWGNVLVGKCPVGEVSFGEVSVGDLSIGEVSVGEMSGRETVLQSVFQYISPIARGSLLSSQIFTHTDLFIQIQILQPWRVCFIINLMSDGKIFGKI